MSKPLDLERMQRRIDTYWVRPNGERGAGLQFIDATNDCSALLAELREAREVLALCHDSYRDYLGEYRCAICMEKHIHHHAVDCRLAALLPKEDEA